MKSRILKKLALGASCAVLLSALAAQGARAQDMQNTPDSMPAMAVGTVDLMTPPFIPGGDAPNAIGAPGAEAPAKASTQWSRISLKDAVAVGVSTYPEHGIVANNRRATDQELRQARALYLPSVDVRVDGGYEHTENPASRTIGDDDSENLWRYNAGITLTQMLFDGWNTKYENLRQEARVLSISHRVREAAELQGLAVVESYLEVMRQRELLKIARDNVSQHMTFGDSIRDASQSGKSTMADTEQSNARLAAARADESSTREALRTAEAAFIRDVGQEPEDLIMPEAVASALEPTLEEQVKIALHQSPTLAIYEADILVAHQEYQGTGAVMYPKFDLQLQGRQGENLSGIEGRDRNASALVVMNWNLYRGGGDTARRREYINREAQAKEERAKAARGIENDVRQTWARMVSAAERQREFGAQAGANTEVVKAYHDQFDLNRRTLLDVLDLQNELFVSRANEVNARYLNMFATYRLLALKGELLKTLGVPVPREADPKNM